MEKNIAIDTKQAAYELHQYIIAQGQVMGQSISEIGRSLKKMRDEKLFTQLGHDDFESYTTQMLGLKQRQAYNYIQVFETLGGQFLQEHSQLGISRLLLLASVPVTDREDFVEENGVADLTVKELQELTEKYTRQSEQLELLQEDKGVVEQHNAHLQQQIKELESRPIDVAVQQPSEKELEKIRAAERKKVEKELAGKFKADADAAKAKADAALEKAVAAAKKDAEAAAAKTVQANTSALEQERTAALARAAELEDKLALAANNEMVIINLLFEEIQTAVNKVSGCLGELERRDKPTADKLRNAAQAFISKLGELL